MRVDTVTVGDSDSASVGDYDTYYLTTYGSFVKKTGNNDQIFTMYYPGKAAKIGVYIAEQSATTGTKIKVVKDSETDSVKDKNLLVVGGACINKAAAMIVAGKEDALCGDAWAAKTGAGSGKYLIQVVASPYNAQKVAMLVAGYEAAQTTDAVTKVKEGKTSTDVGTKVVGPTVA
jgi:hypothetical protein